MSRTGKSLLCIGVAAAMALPVLVARPGNANADVSIRVGGAVKVRAHARVRVRSHRHRHRHHVRRYVTPRVHHRLRVGGAVYVDGHVYIGPRFAPPPPPVHDCGCCGCAPAVVPAYYQPAPPAPVVVDSPPIERAPAAPLLGIGIYAGSVNVEDRAEGDELGLFGRLRLTRGGALQLEGELSRAEHLDATRVDKRAGAALVWNLAPSSRLNPYLLGGLGVSRTEMEGGDFVAEQSYGELGIGLSLRLTDRLHLAGDLRSGARSSVDDSPTIAKSVAPPTDDEEGFTRGRLSALLYF